MGQGSFGSVRAAVLQSDPTREFAVKIFNKKNSDPKHMKLFLKEIELLKYLNHPYIVNFHEVYENKHEMFIVQEMLRGGELSDRIKLRGGKISEIEAKKYLL
jgi:serine/threonine protein kinase